MALDPTNDIPANLDHVDPLAWGRDYNDVASHVGAARRWHGQPGGILVRPEAWRLCARPG